MGGSAATDLGVEVGSHWTNFLETEALSRFEAKWEDVRTNDGPTQRRGVARIQAVRHDMSPVPSSSASSISVKDTVAEGAIMLCHKFELWLVFLYGVGARTSLYLLERYVASGTRALFSSLSPQEKQFYCQR